MLQPSLANYYKKVTMNSFVQRDNAKIIILEDDKISCKIRNLSYALTKL